MAQYYGLPSASLRAAAWRRMLEGASGFDVRRLAGGRGGSGMGAAGGLSLQVVCLFPDATTASRAPWRPLVLVLPQVSTSMKLYQGAPLPPAKLPFYYDQVCSAGRMGMLPCCGPPQSEQTLAAVGADGLLAACLCCRSIPGGQPVTGEEAAAGWLAGRSPRGCRRPGARRWAGSWHLAPQHASATWLLRPSTPACRVLADLLVRLVQATAVGLAMQPLSRTEEKLPRHPLLPPLTPNNYETNTSTCWLGVRCGRAGLQAALGALGAGPAAPVAAACGRMEMNAVGRPPRALQDEFRALVDAGGAAHGFSWVNERPEAAEKRAQVGRGGMAGQRVSAGEALQSWKVPGSTVCAAWLPVVDPSMPLALPRMLLPQKWGFVALQPGASLELSLDTRVASSEAATNRLIFSYLASYEGMGVARVECVQVSWECRWCRRLRCCCRRMVTSAVVA